MKLSLNWLKDYIDPELSTEKLVERLTMAGLEVESVSASGRDVVLEIEITPNRPDCLSILGLAREIGAITGKPVKFPKIKEPQAISLKDLVDVENKNDCSRYIATFITDVHIKPAPEQIRERLASMGIHTINNAVDITNFVLMEYGQPLHAFDYDKLEGGKIIVRRAKAGESILTLGGIERKLDPSILVIADAKKPVAIAGIMGGKATEITGSTKNILLESAHFDMGLVRRASRALGLRSDSSYRFERDVNVDGVPTGAERATQLLLQTAGGGIAGRQEISLKPRRRTLKIKITLGEIESLLGLRVSAAQVKAALARLGFLVKAKGSALSVTPPSSRADVTQSVDLIEEVARMTGFDRLPSKMPLIKTTNISVDQRPLKVKETIRRVLTAGGLDEAVTLSLVSGRAITQSHMPQTALLRVVNPLSQEQEFLRPRLLSSLLQVAASNFNHGQKNLRLFEISKTFKDEEKDTVAIMLTGRRRQDWRLPQKESVDFFDLKGVIQNVFDGLGLAVDYGPFEISFLDPASSAAILLDGKHIGGFGKIGDQVLHNFGIKNQDVYTAGFYLEDIFASTVKTTKYEPISEFPAIVRDVSMAVKKEIPYKQVEEICRKNAGGILKDIRFAEQYLGDKIQPGLKGLVFSCIYQSHDRTLREDEVAAVHQRILKVLQADLCAMLR